MWIVVVVVVVVVVSFMRQDWISYFCLNSINIDRKTEHWEKKDFQRFCYPDTIKQVV